MISWPAANGWPFILSIQDFIIMRTVIVQLITSYIGSVAFGMIFGLRRRYLLVSGLGGLLAWAIYLGSFHFLGSEFFCCLLASAFAALFAELLAHLCKAPSTLFLIPALIPLIPGSFLYYTMSATVQSDMETARFYGKATLTWALAIAAGISLVVAIRELKTKRQ